jgi:hypothetical protein
VGDERHAGSAGDDNTNDTGDRQAILAVVDTFFGALISADASGSLHAEMAALRDLFLPQAVIVRTCGAEPVCYGVDEFIAPRQELLESGRLREFAERPLPGRVDRFGDVAQWFGGYTKSWSESETLLDGRGMKSIQLVRTRAGWRISAVAWDDERPGVPFAESG